MDFIMYKPKVFDNSPRTCMACFALYTPTRNWQKTCSHKCGYTYRNNLRKQDITNFGACARCGKGLQDKFATAIYCSRTCKSMDHTFKHRAKTRTKGVSRRREIYERDNGTCYMCNVNLELKQVELDHLVPASRLGDSSPANLAISCMRCNRSRGTKIGIEQLTKLYELRA
jgi:hypothetical protein